MPGCFVRQWPHFPSGLYLRAPLIHRQDIAGPSAAWCRRIHSLQRKMPGGLPTVPFGLVLPPERAVQDAGIHTRKGVPNPSFQVRWTLPPLRCHPARYTRKR